MKKLIIEATKCNQNQKKGAARTYDTTPLCLTSQKLLCIDEKGSMR